MCGRFTLTIHHLGSVVQSLQAIIDEQLLDLYRPRYNIAPGNPHWILRSEAGRREIVPAGWGLINRWAKDPSVGYRQINARSETLSQRPAWREAYQHRRCAVPADGFYEWHGPRTAREPVWFHSPDDSLLLFAGLWESWQNGDTGELRDTFTIITTPANEVVARIHHRMPALLSQDQLDEWLTSERPEGLLKAAANDSLIARPVSSRVNSPANDDPQCLEPVQTPSEPPPPAKRQLKLF